MRQTEAAIHGDTGLARWDRDGNLAWSVALEPDDLLGVAIDPRGVVHAAARNLDNGETLNLRRFAPDGTELPLLESVVAQARGMLVIDPVGRLLVTGSGHSHTDFGARSLDLTDPDFAPNGIAAAASDAAWFHEDNDDSFAARAWTLERVHADGSSTPRFFNRSRSKSSPSPSRRSSVRSGHARCFAARSRVIASR